MRSWFTTSKLFLHQSLMLTDDIPLDLAFQLETNVKLGFDRSTDPYGRPWLPPKVREGGQPLVDKGHLRDSMTHQVNGDSVAVGTNLEYARIQNFGGTIKPVNAQALRFFVGNQAVFVGQVTIPPRPFFPNATEGLPGGRGRRDPRRHPGNSVNARQPCVTGIEFNAGLTLCHCTQRG